MPYVRRGNAGDAVGGPANLERAGALQALGLQVDLRIGHFAEGARVHCGRAMGYFGQNLVGFLHVF